MPTTNNIFSYSSNPLPVKPSASRKEYKVDGNNFTLMSGPWNGDLLIEETLREDLKRSFFLIIVSSPQPREAQYR
jgi:hypothetical protein